MRRKIQGPDERVWLDDPYAEKEEVKVLGARWDPIVKRWYAPTRDERFSRWFARPELPDPLPGEDRAFGAGLFVDLVPASCWFTNVRSCISPADWERLRRMITRRAGNRCEICGATEERRVSRWLEAHERWEYIDATRTQVLRRIVCLCTNCHLATHFGYAEVRGKGEAALRHLGVVTGMSEAECEAHVDAAVETWKQRSRHQWKLDLGIITAAGIRAHKPSSETEQVVRQMFGSLRSGIFSDDDLF